MSSVSLRKDGPTVTANEAGREFWRAVLLARGFTAIPRWTLDPVSGVGEHVVRINPESPTALRRLANDLGVPLSSLLLAAHARVLGALSREREVCTGYAVESGSPLPCRMTIGRRTWREVVLEAARSESDLLRHKDHPLDDLRRELEHLHETRHDTFLNGSPHALEHHTQRMFELEKAYRERFPWETPDDARTRKGSRALADQD